MLAHLSGPAIAVDLPPTSMRGGPGRNDVPAGIDALHLADFADAVLVAADGAGFDRFVLVGHSLAGLTICEVARRAPERVARLVFVSALVPPEGASALDAMPPEIIGRVSGGLTEDTIVHMFCNDLDESQTRFVLDHVGGDVVQVMVEPVTRLGIPPELSMTYVRLKQDQALPPAAQDASIAALEAMPGVTVDIVDLDTGHNVMIGHPAELAAVIDASR
jgi:pimeloyl-ACP methyl ester carboxylesterase